MTLHVVGNFCPGDIEESLPIVKILDHQFRFGTGSSNSRPLYDQWHLHRLVVHPTLVEPAMISNEEPLVGRVNNDRVAVEADVLKRIHDRADAFVDTFYAAQIVLGVALKFPAN